MKIALDAKRSAFVSNAIQAVHIRNMQSVLTSLGYPIQPAKFKPSKDEGSQSIYYWNCLTNFIKKKLPEFSFFGRRPVGYRYNFSAMSEINSLRNYIGALHESLVRKFIHEAGLLPEVGFSHSEQPGKEPLVWDAIELMRTHMDVLTLNLLIRHEVVKSDFKRLDNLEIYLKADACKKVIQLVGEWFNSDCGLRLPQNQKSWESCLRYNIRQLVPMEARHTRRGELGKFNVPLPQPISI